MDVIPVGSDFDLILTGARDAITGDYFNGATVTGQLYTSAGVTVGSPVTCDYVAASNGIYAGVIESTTTATLTTGANYYAIFTLSSGSVDATFRADFTAQAPGGTIVDATIWQATTGISLTAGSADELSIEQICSAVCEALTRRLYPTLLVPQTLTLFPFDAPVKNVIQLPRPVRSISAIYVHGGANGDSSLIDTTADVILPGTGYYSKQDDVLNPGWNRKGEIYRRPAGLLWGWEYRSSGFNTLAPQIEPNLGAVFVSANVGPDRVSYAVQQAAIVATTLAYNRRKTGTPVVSASLNGGSYSLAPQALAMAAIESPEVIGWLQAAGVGPVPAFG